MAHIKIYQNGAFVGVTGSSNIARITSIDLAILNTMKVVIFQAISIELFF